MQRKFDYVHMFIKKKHSDFLDTTHIYKDLVFSSHGAKSEFSF